MVAKTERQCCKSFSTFLSAEREKKPLQEHERSRIACKISSRQYVGHVFFAVLSSRYFANLESIFVQADCIIRSRVIYAFRVSECETAVNRRAMPGGGGMFLFAPS